MSNYYYKAEWNGVTYLRSSNGQYAACLPLAVRNLTVVTDSASWTFDQKRIDREKRSGYTVLEAQPITASEFRALSKVARAQAKAARAKWQAEYDAMMEQVRAECAALAKEATA